jgi:TPR repeat protein
MKLKTLLLTVLLSISLNGVAYAEKTEIDINKTRQAAEQGDAESQRYLANKYLTGDGVLQDLKEAAEWMTRAAKGGDGVAQYSLGVMYLNTYGLDFSPKKAKYWIKKSYENSNTPKGTLELVKKTWDDWKLGHL